MATGSLGADNIRQQAAVIGLPSKGPYYPYIDAEMVAKLLTSRGLVGTIWKKSQKGFGDLPDMAITMVDYDQVGRGVLYHRHPGRSCQQATQYVVDT